MIKQTFWSTSLDAGAVSLRQLQRLLDVNGDAYKGNQKRIINYIVTKVIPDLLDEKKINYICNNFESIMLNYNSKRLQPVFINRYENSDEENDFNVIKKEMEELIKCIQALEKKDNDIIGNCLWNIYNILKKQHENNCLVFSIKKIKNENRVEFPENYCYAPQLSTQIVGFIRYLGIIPDGYIDKDLMSTVDEVVYSNANEFFVDYKVIITKTSLNNALNSNLFIEDSNDNPTYKLKLIELRKFLLNKLLNKDYFKELIVNFLIIKL